MPQAIISKYLPATNTRGSRIKASCERGSITIDYPHELSGDACHIAAADALVAKFVKEDIKQYQTPADKNPWNRPRVCGGLPNGDRVHVYGDFNNGTVIQFASAEDCARFHKFTEAVKTSDGSRGPQLSALAAMALRNAKV